MSQADPAPRLTAALADRYVIERELGAGGMATVYLAEDLKHKRQVAIKVLKPELAAVLGAERFVQEITTTAALQHPHILPLFDSGEADGFLYYVMPFIDGETLRDKLDRETQLGVDEAVKITTDVADALHHAHTQGVVHRDIKPENILLQNGRPMVADFGIALAVSAAAGGRMTETGLSLGTPHYMSPEQATAEKDISARSDQYSLASVLYEMLAGQPPHLGGSAQQIIMKIITEAPADVATLRKSVPPNVAAALATALEKLPADRFASAEAFARALGDRTFTRNLTFAGPPAASEPAAGSMRWRGIAAASLTLAIALGAVAGWALLRTGAGPRDTGLPPLAPMQMGGTLRNVAVAHDGSFIVYVASVNGSTQLWYQSLRSVEARAIPGTGEVGGTPRLSPDDTRVAFVSLGVLKVATLAGGTVSTIGEAQDPQGGEWLPDGTLFFGDRDGRLLRWIDPATGAEREIESAYCLHPQLIDATRVLCGGGSQKWAAVIDVDRPFDKLALRLRSDAPDAGAGVLLGAHFRLIDGRYLVYMSIDGTLMGTRIEDLDSLTVGRSVALVPLVRRSAYSGVGQYDLADDGTLIYVPGVNADIGRLVRVSRDGRLDTLPVPVAAFQRFSSSPDDQRIAAVIEGLREQELRVFDLNSGATEVYDAGFFVGAPAWSPDGGSLAYVKSDDPLTERLLVRELNAPGGPRELTALERGGGNQVSAWLTPERILLGSASTTVGAMLVDPTRTPAGIDSLPLNTFFGSISPDGQWIAYQSTGITGIQLQPWPAMDRRYLVDPDGTEPRWGRANELLYLTQYRTSGVSAAAINRARIEIGSTNPIGQRDVVARDPRFADTPGWSFALTASGDVIYLQSPSESLGHYVRVVPDWVAQMKRAVDEANR